MNKEYWIYFENEVWGNKKEGYDVNNSIITSICFDLNGNASSRDIFNKLKKAGIIKKGVHFSSFFIDECDSFLYMSFKGIPFGDLRRFVVGDTITVCNKHREFILDDYDLI